MALSYNQSTGKLLQLFPINIYGMTLANGVEQHFTVPGLSVMGNSSSINGNNVVATFSINPTSDVWVNNTTTATVPTTAASVNNVRNPDELVVLSGSVLSFITNNSSGAEISISFRAAF